MAAATPVYRLEKTLQNGKHVTIKLKREDQSRYNAWWYTTVILQDADAETTWQTQLAPEYTLAAAWKKAKNLFTAIGN